MVVIWALWNSCTIVVVVLVSWMSYGVVDLGVLELVVRDNSLRGSSSRIIAYRIKEEACYVHANIMLYVTQIRNKLLFSYGQSKFNLKKYVIPN